MTGAVIPAGADAVVPVEDTDHYLRKEGSPGGGAGISTSPARGLFPSDWTGCLPGGSSMPAGSAFGRKMPVF